MQLNNKRGAEELYLKGKAKWANRLYVPDIEYKKWGLVLYPDHASLEIIRDLQAQGVKNVLKKDDDGYYISLGRPTEKVIRGKVIPFSPPVVLDADGNATTVSIGNGSDVTVKMEVYSHGTPTGGKAKAMRLQSVRIDNLVPYAQDSFTPEEQELTAGLAEQPPQF
jgi:hypothetical protein